MERSIYTFLDTFRKCRIIVRTSYPVAAHGVTVWRVTLFGALPIPLQPLPWDRAGVSPFLRPPLPVGVLNVLPLRVTEDGHQPVGFSRVGHKGSLCTVINEWLVEVAGFLL